MDIETIDGTTRLKIPHGTPNGSLLRLKGKGMPRLRGGYGDLFVKIQVEVPKKLSRKARKLIEELARELPETE
ncbi:MAG TPA: hypothetical protein ENI45_04520 [Thermoplasmatales archaeon]|nr:hypothetical protein [Thermoplasmatales archaeon]